MSDSEMVPQAGGDHDETERITNPMKTTPKKKTAAPKTPKKAGKPAVKRALNIRQQRFAEFVVSGMSDVQAYIAAGYTKSQACAETNAWRLRDHEGVEALIARLRAPQTKAAVLTKEEKLAFLAQIIRTPIGQVGPDSPLCQEYSEDQIGGGNRGTLKRGNKPSGNEIIEAPIIRRKTKMADKLRAMDLHSKLAGDFAPEQMVVETGPKTLEAVRERAKLLASPMSRPVNSQPPKQS